jgi:hypothetical protein
MTETTLCPAAFTVRYETMTRDGNPAWQRRAEALCSLKLGGRWRSSFDPIHDTATFELRPELPSIVRHPGPELYETVDEKPVLYYAVDEDKNLVGWRIGGPMVHTLVIGPTGGGKTTVFRSLIAGAVMSGIPVYGCDPKRVELRPFEGYPGVGGIASSDEQMADLITDMYNLMNQRYALIERDPSTKNGMTPVLFILDELLILRKALTRLWKSTPDDNGKKRTGTAIWLEYIQEMLALARTAKIHLVIGVQRPDASLFEEGARDNLQHRISLMRLSPQGAKMLWGDSHTGTDLPVKQGRAIASPHGTDRREVQSFWLSDPAEAIGEDMKILDAIADRASEKFVGFGWPVDRNKYVLEGRIIAQERDDDELPEQRVEVSADGTVRRLPVVPVPAVEDQDNGDEGHLFASSGELTEQVIEGANVDTEDVRAESLCIGDKIVTDAGLIATVADIEDDAMGDDLVMLTLDVYGDLEALSCDSSDMVPRVLDFDTDHAA